MDFRQIGRLVALIKQAGDAPTQGEPSPPDTPTTPATNTTPPTQPQTTLPRTMPPPQQPSEFKSDILQEGMSTRIPSASLPSGASPRPTRGAKMLFNTLLPSAMNLEQPGRLTVGRSFTF